VPYSAEGLKVIGTSSRTVDEVAEAQSCAWSAAGNLATLSYLDNTLRIYGPGLSPTAELDLAEFNPPRPSMFGPLSTSWALRFWQQGGFFLQASYRDDGPVMVREDGTITRLTLDAGYVFDLVPDD
jgi:hypothetical protein